MNPAGARHALEAAYRTEARRVLATLIRLLGGFDAAEEALHEAFAAAAERWPRDGVPASPYAWLVSTGRFKTIDRWRRQARLTDLLPELAAVTDLSPEMIMAEPIPDDELRLIFTCCHPVLAPDARIALTLREVAGLTTEEIARAYLAPAPTIAQRIVRAKAKIRDAAIPYEVPAPAALPARIESVLQVVYLVFNEGYVATTGPSLTRDDLCMEAIRLGRLVVDLLDDPEALGLLALMLLHQARRAGRVDPAGDLVLLEDQDRSLWDRDRIAEAQGLIERALSSRRTGPYLLQAAIAALHAEAPSTGQTDWPQIVALYDVMHRLDPSQIVALNRAAALGMRDGPEAGLAAIEMVIGRGDLDGYHLAHAARADMQRRLGRIEAARSSYRRALELTRQPAERRFLQGRLDRLGTVAIEPERP
ncbi:MAG TPA: RNA polymerase sigma factor [Aliidongia sp.]|uniref:RNA polymerase sigma factor n=1 Tax=Aliidongia sp. TaxID=1914230 RepID=UPI002DDD8593|nr:RNA polymerase sigma factor [Aliidongia sp.]HEV2678217.1 RNA polymerase sigma factor [Aliidongia sp.]